MARVPNPLPYILSLGRWFLNIERGVRWFSAFLVLLTAGFALMLADMAGTSVIAGIGAILCVLLMVFTRPPHAIERDMAETARATEGGSPDDDLEGRGTSEIDTVAAMAPPAPTRAAPAPPPEPPSMDILADAEEGDVDEPEADEAAGDDVWVES